MKSGKMIFWQIFYPCSTNFPNSPKKVHTKVQGLFPEETQTCWASWHLLWILENVRTGGLEFFC